MDDLSVVVLLIDEVHTDLSEWQPCVKDCLMHGQAILALFSELRKGARMFVTLGPGDRDDLLELLTHFDFDEAAAEASSIQASFDAMMAMPGMHVCGIRIEGQLVATCVLSVVPNLTRQARPYALIENVVVHREFRRAGHGTAVLDGAVGIAKEADCYKVMLMTGSSRRSTHRFYEKAGFDPNAKHAFAMKFAVVGDEGRHAITGVAASGKS